MGDEDRHLSLAPFERVRDLLRRKNEPTRRVQQEIDRHIGRRESDRAQHVLGVLDVDVPRHGEAEDAHRLLAVDHRDQARVARLLDRPDRGLTAQGEHPLLQQWDEELRDEEEEEDRVQVEHERSMLHTRWHGDCGTAKRREVSCQRSTQE